MLPESTWRWIVKPYVPVKSSASPFGTFGANRGLSTDSTGGTAASGPDYYLTAGTNSTVSGSTVTCTVPANTPAAGACTFSATVIDDVINEGPEQFRATITSSNANTTGATAQTITITDNEAGPDVALTVNTTNPGPTETIGEGETATVRATLSEVSGLPVTVIVTFGTDSDPNTNDATNTVDYIVRTNSGTSSDDPRNSENQNATTDNNPAGPFRITIPAGQLYGSVQVQSFLDNLANENPEVLTAEITSATTTNSQSVNSNPANDEVAITINTRPPGVAPSLTFSDASGTTLAAATVAENAGTVTFYIRRDGGSASGPIQACAVLSQGNTANPGDSRDLGGATANADVRQCVTFATTEGAGTVKPVTFTITDDMQVEGDEVFTFELRSNDASTTNAPLFTLTVTDNDSNTAEEENVVADAVSAVFPNPMSSASTLEVSVATAQHVRVTVIDALGREALVAFDSEMGAGRTARVRLDGADLPAGMYVVLVQGETLREARRMTVVK